MVTTHAAQICFVQRSRGKRQNLARAWQDLKDDDDDGARGHGDGNDTMIRVMAMLVLMVSSIINTITTVRRY